MSDDQFVAILQQSYLEDEADLCLGTITTLQLETAWN